MTGSDVRRVSRCLGVALALLSLSLSTSALAEPTAADKEKARELMAHGREQRDKQNLEAALKSFQGADAIMHVPTTAFEVARTQQMMGQLVEARATLEALSKLPSSATDPQPFMEARTKAASLAGELDAQIPAIKIVVTSADPSVTPVVTVDDRTVTDLESAQRVNPGDHVVVARGGGAEATARVTLAQAETKEVALRLEIAPPPAPPPPPKEEPPSPGVPLVSWVGFGLGVAGLAVGSVTGVMAISQEGDIADKCPDKRCPRAFEGDLDGARAMATVSTVGFVVAGVGAAVGVVGLLVRGSSPRTTATAATATGQRVRVRLGGAGLAGTF